MEDRFIEIGKEYANKIAVQYKIPLDDDLIQACSNYKWHMFIADMSDDYSRTLREQKAHKARFNLYISERLRDVTS